MGSAVPEKIAGARIGHDRFAGGIDHRDGVAKLVAKSDDRVPVGCVRVAAAHATTAMLGEMFGQISVERA